MLIEHYSPTDALKPFVKGFLLLDTTTETDNRVLPDTSMVLAFRYKGRVSDIRAGETHPLPFAVLTGLRKSSRLLRYDAQTATLLVLFGEGGAAAFFREPLHELFSLSQPLDDLIPQRELAKLEEQLAEAPDHPNRLALVERFLLARLQPSGPGPLVAHAIRTIQTSHGLASMKALAQSLAISQDALEKRFRRSVGTPTKQFASLVRFRHLLSIQQPGTRLTDLAYEAGYFDQAHFIRDFRLFTGQSPQEFFKSSRYW